MSHLVWYTRCMIIETDMKEETKTKTVVMSEARRKAKRDIAHLTKLGILKGVKVVPLTPPTQKELDNSTSKGTRVLTYEESMER
jgi:hypothetical protein